LATVFLLAAVTKVTDPQEFTRQTVAVVQGVAPESPVAEAIAVGASTWLPWLELAAAACLLFGYAVREAALMLAVLLTVFLGYGLIPREDPDCSCMFFPRGVVDLPGWWPAVRNVLLLVCALRTAFPPCHRRRNQPA
jgi:uncharacterized membrane protein YphA (DoxX/SURF4 family)